MLLLIGVVFVVLGILALLNVIVIGTTAAVLLLIAGIVCVALHYRGALHR